MRRAWSPLFNNMSENDNGVPHGYNRTYHALDR